MQYEWWIQ